MADPKLLVQQLVDAQARLKAVDRDGNHQFSRQEVAEAVIAQWPTLHPEDQDFSKLRAALALQQEVDALTNPKTARERLLHGVVATSIG